MWAYEYSKFIGLKGLERVERPDPAAGPRDIVLRMRAFALNYRDLAIADGHYHVGVQAPLIPFSDGAGEVVDVGSSVSRFRIGDLACPTYLPDWIEGPVRPGIGARRLGGPTDGVFAEFMCVAEAEAVLAPAHLDAREAATLPVTAVTAWHQLVSVGGLVRDEAVLIQGTGGVSTAALLLAKARGARAIVLVREARHGDRLRDMGADEVIVSAGDEWLSEVAAATGGKGVDAVVNVAGGPTLDPTISALRVGGRLHLIGYAGGTSASLDIFNAIRRGASIHVATAGSRASFEEMTAAMERSGSRPPVAATFQRDRVQEAFACLREGGHLGKMVIEA